MSKEANTKWSGIDAAKCFPPTISFSTFTRVGNDFIVVFMSENDKTRQVDPFSRDDHVLVLRASTLQVLQSLDFAELCVDPEEVPGTQATMESYVCDGNDVFFTAHTRCVYALHCDDSTMVCSLSARLLHLNLQAPIIVGASKVAVVDAVAYVYMMDRKSLRLLWKRNAGYFPEYGAPSSAMYLSDRDEIYFVTGPFAVGVSAQSAEMNWYHSFDVGTYNYVDPKVARDTTSGVLYALFSNDLYAFRPDVESQSQWSANCGSGEFTVRSTEGDATLHGLLVLKCGSSGVVAYNSSSGAVVWELPASVIPLATLGRAVGDYVFIGVSNEVVVVNISDGKVYSSFYGLDVQLFSHLVATPSGTVIAWGANKKDKTHIAVLNGPSVAPLPTTTPAPTTPTTTSPSSQQPRPSSPSAGAVAAIVAASMAFACAVAFAFIRFARYMKRREEGAGDDASAELRSISGEDKRGSFGSLNSNVV